MADYRKLKDKEAQKLLNVLGQALQIEYSMIYNYSRIAAAIDDDETRTIVKALGTASIKHSNEVANVIELFGGHVAWSIKPLPGDCDLLYTFQEQMSREQLARQLHYECSEMVSDPALKARFRDIAREEEMHIQMVYKILATLKQQKVKVTF
jgi:rubrerythrin